MTVVEVRSDSGEEWQPVTYTDPEIDNAVSDIKVVPEASVGIADRSAVSSGDQLRFRDESDDTILFEGFVERTRPSTQGPTGVEAVHRAARLFDESVSVELESPTAEDVLQEALLQADSSGFSLNYDGTATALADAYDVENRDVKRIFRDMTERTGRVWWVGVDDTIHVEEPGARGTLASIDTATDPGVRVRDYVPDDIDTIVNDVTVRGTGGESVEGSATNAASIDEYGKQPETVNVEYIRSVGEANDYAEALLRPDPSASADVLVSNRAVDMREPVVNHTLAVTDGATGLDEELVIERQRVEQSRARVDLGEGAGVNIAKFNRSQKSDDDTTKPGSVYGNDRIATNAIDTQQLVDTAVIESKLDDLSVSLEKVQDDAIDTVKIRDDAIEAPKILAESVTAAKLDTDLARANRLLAGEIEAIDIQTGTLTANEIDTLELSTGQLTVGVDNDDGIEFTSEGADGATRTAIIPTANVAFVGTHADRFRGTFSSLTSTTIIADGVSPRVLPDSDGSGQVGESDRAFDSVYAYDFIDASTGDSITDGGDPLRGLSTGHGPPDTAAVRDGAGGLRGYSVSGMAREAWDVIRAQQRVIDELESRIDELESAVDPNA